MPDAPTDRKQQAQVYCRRALDYYEQNNHAAAIKALGTALELDRSLRDDPRIQRFAARLVGLPVSQAINALSDRETREAQALQIAKRTPRKTTSLGSNPLWIIGILLITVAVVGVIALFSLGHIGLTTPSQSQGERYTLTSDPTQEYLVAAPNDNPPEDGWQAVVAIHGAGQTGQDMIDTLGETARSRGILLIAPTFTAIRDGNAGEGFYENARTTLLKIVDEITQMGMANPRLYTHYLGQVYLGYAEGASLVTYTALNGLDYADSGFVMEGPMGVVLVNPRAPLYDATRYPIPYMLLYGELAPQAGIARDYNERLTQQGTEVYLIEAEGADTAMSSQQLTIMADFVQQVNYPPTQP